MRRFAPVAALTLASCASSGVVPTGQGAYMVSTSQWGFTSASVHKARLMQDAAAFCQSHGKQMEVTGTSQNELGLGKIPGAEVQFRCVVAEK